MQRTHQIRALVGVHCLVMSKACVPSWNHFLVRIASESSPIRYVVKRDCGTLPCMFGVSLFGSLYWAFPRPRGSKSCIQLATCEQNWTRFFVAIECDSSQSKTAQKMGGQSIPSSIHTSSRHYCSAPLLCCDATTRWPGNSWDYPFGFAPQY